MELRAKEKNRKNRSAREVHMTNKDIRIAALQVNSTSVKCAIYYPN